MKNYADLVLRRRAALFCPGACGFPFRGELSFAASTNSSRRFLGTERTPRITSLKCWNSGVESNGAAFILSPSGHEFASRVPGAFGKEGLSSTLRFPGQLFVSQAASNNLFHDSGE